MMRRGMFLALTVALLAGCLALLSGPRVVMGQDPTIPTRTPTPDPNAPPTAVPTAPPTNTPGSGGQEPPPPPPPPSGDPGSGATATAIPQSPATATATNAPQQAAPAEDPATAQPTAAAATQGVCDDAAYARALEPLNVLAGPGADYPVVSVLQSEEVRQIRGRAAYAAWWQVQVDSTSLGWVPDELVEASGDTGSVPVVEAPPINGTAPTPGVAWEPTPLPFTPCETPPAPTETPTPLPTATSIEPQPTPTESVLVVVDISSEPNEAAGVSVTLPDEEAVAIAPTASGTTPLSRYVMPAVGLVLVAAGVGLAVFSRRPPSSGKK